MPRKMIALTVLLAAAFAVNGCKKSQDNSGQPKVASPDMQAPTKDVTPGPRAAAKNPRVVIKTTLGDIYVELNQAKAPISVKNFLRYTDEKFYDNTIFHRVMSTFMIQGGGFGKDKVKKRTHAPIKNEADNGLSNGRGTIAMARTRRVDSATAQFFINVVDNSRLDHSGPGPRFGYAVFGKVYKGLDVVDKIRNTPVSNQGGPFANLPDTMVVIQQVRRVQ